MLLRALRHKMVKELRYYHTKVYPVIELGRPVIGLIVSGAKIRTTDPVTSVGTMGEFATKDHIYRRVKPIYDDGE